MEKLIELANLIKDGELKKKVIDFLRNPTPSHKDFRKYPQTDIKKVKTPFSTGSGTAQRDVLNHTIAVVESCVKTAEVVEKTYGIQINKDQLIAAAILHDIMKIFEWKLDKDGDPEPTGVLLDHTMLATAELYSRGFPERVIHMVASHFGEHGPTPPRNFEALIMHHVDNMMAVIEFHQNRIGSHGAHMPVIVLDEEMIKKLRDQNG